MIQIFASAFTVAAAAMATVAAWLLAGVLLLAVLAVAAVALAALFDAATSGLRWVWRKTGHKPRNKIQRIIMGQPDDR